MTDPAIVAEPGGLALISRWIDELFSKEPAGELWTVLDDRLRLALAQGWVLGAVGEVDDDLAEDLAADDSTNGDFPQMLADLTRHWRSVYTDLRHGFGVWNQVNLVGADMELVALASLERVGHHPAGDGFPAQCFVTRLEADEWLIAALARGIPVPGWPPTEEIILGLDIDP